MAAKRHSAEERAGRLLKLSIARNRPWKLNTSKLRRLAKKAPDSARLTAPERLQIYYELGGLLPEAIGEGARRPPQGWETRFRNEWDRAGGMTLSRSLLFHCRRFVSDFTVQQAKQAIAARVCWRAIRMLCSARISQERRQALLDQACKPHVKAADIKQVVR